MHVVAHHVIYSSGKKIQQLHTYTMKHTQYVYNNFHDVCIQIKDGHFVLSLYKMSFLKVVISNLNVQKLKKSLTNFCHFLGELFCHHGFLLGRKKLREQSSCMKPLLRGETSSVYMMLKKL
jgi:hypothetical protein